MPAPTPPTPNFPGALPSLNKTATKGSGNPTTGANTPYADSNQQAVEIEAMALKLGIEGSDDPASIDYRARALEARPTAFAGALPIDLRTGRPTPTAALRALPDGTPYVDSRGRLHEWRAGRLNLVAARDALDPLDVLPERGYRNGGTQAMTTGGASADFDSPRYYNVVMVRRTIHRLPRIFLLASNAVGGGALSADCVLSVQAGLMKAVPNGGVGFRRFVPGPLFRNCRYQTLNLPGQYLIDNDCVPLYPIDGAPPTVIPPGVYYLGWSYRLRGTTPPSLWTRAISPGANAAFKADRTDTTLTYASAWSSTVNPTTTSGGTFPADFVFDAELRP